MKIEAGPEHFNKDIFYNEFESTLLKYVKTADVINNSIYLDYKDEDGHRIYSESEKENFFIQRNEAMEKLISMSLNALTLSEDKSEILALIFNTFSILSINTRPGHDLNEFLDDHGKLEFAKKIILGLLTK